MRTSMSGAFFRFIFTFDALLQDLFVSPSSSVCCCRPQSSQSSQSSQSHQSLRSPLKRDHRQRPGCSCGFVLD